MKGKKTQKSEKRKRLNLIFLLILLALVMFIISTYAWFTTQKNVSITNLSGTVQVAEGLEISLDAENWSNGIVLGTEEGQLSIIDDAYDGHHNISPSEMMPVSTLGLVGSTDTDLTMIRGKVTNSVKLSEIAKIDESLQITDPTNAQFAGYFAFDIFLKNDSRSTDATVLDTLQLNYDSSLEIAETDKAKTGLQNTVRVAFAKYGVGETGTSETTADQATVLKETAGIGEGAKTNYLTDVAMWEPNSNDHVDYIVKNNNKITWSSTDAAKYANETLDNGGKGFGLTTQMPTYALTNSAIGAEIANIYAWDGSASTVLAKQNTLQTTKTSDSDYTIKEGVQNLVSTKDGTTTFGIASSRISRLRVYVWLEGQDVDCINYASHGGGIKLNIGLVKGSTPGTHEGEGGESAE